MEENDKGWQKLASDIGVKLSKNSGVLSMPDYMTVIIDGNFICQGSNGDYFRLDEAFYVVNKKTGEVNKVPDELIDMIFSWRLGCGSVDSNG